MDGVPYPQPLAGPELQYVPWGVLLVRPIGHPPRPVPPRAADQRSRAYPTFFCVCSGAADTVTGGAPKPLRLGPSPASPVGPFRPAPLFAVWFAVVGVPSLRGGVVVVGGGGGFRCSWLCCLRACRPLPWSWFAAGVCVCGAVRARVVSVLVCGAWFVVCGVRWWCVGGVVAGVWCGWSLATPGGGSRVLLPATPGWVSLPVVVGGPRHSWLRSPGGGGVWWGCGWCVVCLVSRHSWRRFLCATPRHSWLGFAACGGVRFPATPGWGLLAAVVRGVWCVVCGVWCAAVVCWWGGGCGWSLATPGGGSCVLLPATPGWVSLPVAVGGPRHPWLRGLGAVPRHSWLGLAGGGGVWWGCGLCVVWLVPRHYWRRFLCATPRHSWLGFAAGGGVPFPATPGWGLLAVVVRGVWCVVCGGGVLAGVWLVCGVVGPSPLLAEVPVCYSPPLLAGFRCRWWSAVPATPGWGPLAAVVCGVWRWCVGGVVAGVWCGWSLATPGGGSCVLLPATPGWVTLLVVVGGPRHSWLRVPGVVPRHSWLGSVGGGVWRGRSLATPGGGSCVLLPATPGWVSVPVVVCGPPPLLAGVRWRRWCVVCGVWCVVCGVWCVVCGVRRWCAGGVAAGVWCGWFLATPGGGSCVLLPATPGWVSLPAVVGVPRHSWRRVPGAVPRHSPLGFAVGGGVWCVVCGVWRVACGGGVCGGFVAGVWCGWSLATAGGGSCVLLPATPGWVSLPLVVVCVGVRGGRAVLCVACLWCLCFWWCGVVVRWVCLLGALPLALVCVCAQCGPSCWCGWRGGGVVRGVAVVRARVCARGVWLVGWGVSYLGWFSSSVVGMFQKAEEEVL